MKTLLVIALTLLIAEDRTDDPAFEEYRVNVAVLRSPKVDLRSHPIGRKYPTRIRDTVRDQGVNFAGHHTLVTGVVELTVCSWPW